MNIYVDGTLFFGKTHGASRYSTSLLLALNELDEKNRYKVLGFLDDRARPHAVDKKKIKYEYLPVPRQLYNQSYKRTKPIAINRFLKKRPHLVIYPNFVLFPKIKDVKSILVIHDLAFLETPETIAKKNLKYMEKFVPASIRHADAIVAVSEETQNKIAQHFGINASNITVVPNAVEKKFFTYVNAEDRNRVKMKYSLPDDYILFVGTIEPRKNIIRLLEAYIQLPAKIRQAYPLVLAGGAGWKNEKIYARIHELMAEGHSILTIGFIADKDLPAIYQQANLFVFPSLHEGFGLPILEAMAGRTPLATSNMAPMNRIAEDAALFFDPHSPGSMARSMTEILESQTLAKDLINKGVNVAKKHTWESSASILLDLINNLSAGQK